MCLSHIQLKLIPKNVKNHSYCAIGITSELLSQLGMVDKKLDSIYRKKARANWIKHGDMSSKFFHSAIRWRRLKNKVKGVEVDSQWCEEPQIVRVPSG